MWRSIALGMAVICGGAGAAVAQRAVTAQSASVVQRGDVSAEAAVALAYRADALKRAFLSGSEDQIQQAAYDIDLFKKEYGIYDLTPLIEAMCIWALELGHQKRASLGHRVLLQIGQWEPQHPALLAAEVKLHRFGGPVGYFESLPSVAKLYMFRLEDPKSKFFFILHHLAWARFAASILLWGTAAMLAFRYYRFLSHVFERPIINYLPNRHVVAVIAGLILALPVLVGLGPSFCAMVWLLLLVPILTPAEMKFAIFCILIQLVHPGLTLAEHYLSPKSLPLSMLPLQLQTQLIPMESRPKNLLTAGDQQFFKGWNALQSGNWAEAEGIFTELSGRPTEMSAVYNNLGVALQRQNKNAAALDAFVKAGQANPRAFEPPYNQAILHFVNLDTERGGRKLDEARKNDPASFRAVFSPMSSIASILERITIAMPIKDNSARNNALANMYSGMYGDIPRDPDPIDTTTMVWLAWPLLGAAVLAMRRNMLTSFSRQHLCSKCGKPFQITHEVDSDANTCSQCFHIFVLKDQIRTDSQRKKIVQISMYRSRNKLVARILGLIAPGCDNIFLGWSVQGFLAFAMLAFSFGVMVHTSGDTLFPGEIVPDPPSLLAIIGFATAGLLYLQSWYRVFSDKQKV